MDLAALHEQLAGLAPALLAEGGSIVAGAEAHVAAGCSRCARALVNARDATVSLAQTAPAVTPPSSLRERVLAGARLSRWGAETPARAPRRFFDPAGEVARLHVGAAGDAERTAEVDALGLAAPRPVDDGACGRFLAQIQALVRFPLLFVSVLRGDRCGYRAQIGLEGAARDRRRETTFCTHTVSTGAPMVVPDAGAEPFFRGSNMVLRDGIRAYVGVPLRTSRGITVGTVCAMDYAPRRIDPSVVRALELFTEPILAEIEGPPWPRTAAGTPVHPARWFRALLELAEGGHVGGSPPPRLLIAEGPDAPALADRSDPSEPAGLLGEGRVALLLAGPDPRLPAAATRARNLPGEVVAPPFAKLFR